MRLTSLTIVLLLMSVLVLFDRTTSDFAIDWAAGASFIILCLVGFQSNTIRETLLLVASTILAILLLFKEDGQQVFREAISLAAYFAAFISLLTVLKIAAERSRSVLEVGRYLIQQPASGRFIATASGGHLLGVFLNFGAISLMSPLIQNAAKREGGTTGKAMEQRQLSALLRGFAWILLWAPTTMTQAVLLTLFAEIDLSKIIVLGISTAILMIGVGLVYDRFEWRGTNQTTISPPFPSIALCRLGLICGSLVLATAILQISFGLTTALSLMIVAPAMTFLWFAAQRPAETTQARHLSAFWSALKNDVTGLARSAIALGLSGFIGRSLADVLPVTSLTEGLNLSAMPGWLFLAVLPITITLGGQIALSPIILVVFIGQVVQSIPSLPAEPTHIVFALSAGWAISMFASPNATATLLISATTKIPPTQLTWGWNLRYGALCYVILVGIFVLLEA